jgi:hypothetical protein
VEGLLRLKGQMQMQSTVYPMAPLWSAIRAELREARDVRVERKSLERELASYASQDDLDDLDAILGRYRDAETAEIRRILTARRRA